MIITIIGRGSLSPSQTLGRGCPNKTPQEDSSPLLKLRRNIFLRYFFFLFSGLVPSLFFGL